MFPAELGAFAYFHLNVQIHICPSFWPPIRLGLLWPGQDVPPDQLLHVAMDAHGAQSLQSFFDLQFAVFKCIFIYLFTHGEGEGWREEARDGRTACVTFRFSI